MSMLDAGVHITDAGEEAIGSFDVPKIQALVSSKTGGIHDVSEQQKRDVLSALTDARPTLKDAYKKLTVAQTTLDGISDSQVFPLLRPTKRDIDTQLHDATKILGGSLPLIDMLPELLGFPKERTYLLLFQNNAETRATGGFIGNYGILTLKNGEIKTFKVDNIYNIDDKGKRIVVRPPQPFAKYFKTDRWYLRDSNWSPDFPESADKAAWFYQREGGKEKIDGVISTTPEVITSLMRFTGPIRIDDVTFTADNFVTELQIEVEKAYVAKGIPERQRKDVIGQIGEEMKRRLFSMPKGQLFDVANALKLLAEEKHIMVYMTVPTEEAIITKLGWAGEIRPADGDSLMVVDSNMAALKTDLVMDKNINYSVREDKDGSLHATVELRYTNNGTFTWYTTRYRDWVRVYVPQGSVLDKYDGFMVKELSQEKGKVDVAQEHGKTVFAGYLIVEPKQTKLVRLEYTLPSRIVDQIRKDNTYRLRVQKQSGISNQKLKASFSFKNPIQIYEPVGFFNSKTGIRSAEFSSDLRVDRDFSIYF